MKKIGLLFIIIFIAGCAEVDFIRRNADGSTITGHASQFLTDNALKGLQIETDGKGAVHLTLEASDSNQSEVAGKIAGAVTEATIKSLKASGGIPP